MIQNIHTFLCSKPTDAAAKVRDILGWAPERALGLLLRQRFLLQEADCSQTSSLMLISMAHPKLSTHAHNTIESLNKSSISTEPGIKFDDPALPAPWRREVAAAGWGSAKTATKLPAFIQFAQTGTTTSHLLCSWDVSQMMDVMATVMRAEALAYALERVLAGGKPIGRVQAQVVRDAEDEFFVLPPNKSIWARAPFLVDKKGVAVGKGDGVGAPGQAPAQTLISSMGGARLSLERELKLSPSVCWAVPKSGGSAASLPWVKMHLASKRWPDLWIAVHEARLAGALARAQKTFNGDACVAWMAWVAAVDQAFHLWCEHFSPDWTHKVLSVCREDAGGVRRRVRSSNGAHDFGRDCPARQTPTIPSGTTVIWGGEEPLPLSCSDHSRHPDRPDLPPRPTNISPTPRPPQVQPSSPPPRGSKETTRERAPYC
jgi:hypothetical protein